MESSFMLDHWGSQPQTIDGSCTPDDNALSSKDDDKLTPITNWAHLSYIKNQRNTLRAELKVHQVAGAEAKQSVTSLKEKQIATSARNLVRSRKSHYLDGRDAEKRVEELKRSLRIEEDRNKEILEALERASMLTLQCENPAATTTSLAKQYYRCQSKNVYTSPSAEPAFSSSFTAGTTCQPFRDPTTVT
jgi:hypothetical protein